MAKIKTAISIQESLFRKAESLARELEVSRSRLYAMALQEFVEENENEKLLERINTVYEDAPTEDEQKYQARMKRYQKRLVEDEW